MIVVADTSPLNYLLLIDAIHILPALYGEIIVPTEVHEELQHPRAPAVVREWAINPPEWIEIRQAPD